MSKPGGRRRKVLRLGIAGLLTTAGGCVEATSAGERGDCVAPDQTIVRQNVTQAQCTDICPSCSWVGSEER